MCVCACLVPAAFLPSFPSPKVRADSLSASSLLALPTCGCGAHNNPVALIGYSHQLWLLWALVSHHLLLRRSSSVIHPRQRIRAPINHHLHLHHTPSTNKKNGFLRLQKYIHPTFFFCLNPRALYIHFRTHPTSIHSTLTVVPPPHRHYCALWSAAAL